MGEPSTRQEHGKRRTQFLQEPKRLCLLILLVHLQHMLHIKETSSDTSLNLNGSNESSIMRFDLLASVRRKFLRISVLAVSVRC